MVGNNEVASPRPDHDIDGYIDLRFQGLEIGQEGRGAAQVAVFAELDAGGAILGGDDGGLGVEAGYFQEGHGDGRGLRPGGRVVLIGL